MSVLINKTYDEIQEGDSATLERTLTEKELVLFAAVSGDVNPVHLDADFAKTTMFGEQIAHGMWSGSLISAALATVLPGPGTIYLGQELSFRRPVKLADTLTVTLTVKEKLSKNRVVIDTLVTNQNEEKVVVGTATVMAPTEKAELQAPELPEITIG
ncbi:MaoC/PaaZ C-terminal domain-containing protein [Oceanospirillum sediminis]|uniref:MaoC family dehydratase N-terminal domain-containing protein n=1 Tax=Oceanospirillum sediminis TaxID=2760088 RepID=A0A839IP92_9GAMM|nr:MaoC/PaaZ C-terminal domain-containing protein [Oceanospirillum sediminis]MBB1487075.1 MaoC family dehydratase N-terminal domain-containing protein [Oceanospirillum sediminis]